MDFLLSLVSDPLVFSAGAATALSVTGGGLAVRKFGKRKPKFAQLNDTRKVSDKHRHGYKELEGQDAEYQNKLEAFRNDFSLKFPHLNFEEVYESHFSRISLTEHLRDILIKLNKIDNEHITLKELDDLDIELKKNINYGKDSLAKTQMQFINEVTKDMKHFDKMKPIIQQSLTSLTERMATLEKNKEQAIEKFDKMFIQELRPLVFTASDNLAIFAKEARDLDFMNAYRINQLEKKRKTVEESMDKAEEYLDTRYNFEKVALTATVKYRHALRYEYNRKWLAPNSGPGSSYGIQKEALEKALKSIIEAESYDYTQAQNPDDMLEELLKDYFEYTKKYG